MGKATKGYKRLQGLTIEQLKAIDLLILGKTDQEVADEINMNRVTITKWRNYDIFFQAELNKKRKEILGASLDKIRSLIPRSIERLEKEVESENGWKVALEIIKLAGIKHKDIINVGHEEPDKILTELAQQKQTEDLFNISDDYLKQQLFEEYQQQLKYEK